MKQSERGSLLVFSIWVLVLITAFAISLGYAVRQRLTLLSRFENETSGYLTAMAGVEKFRGMLKQAGGSETFSSLYDVWYDNPIYFKEIELKDTGTFTVGYVRASDDRQIYGVIDEERKINLNSATPQILSRLLMRVAALPSTEAEALAYAIVDWRDSDSNYSHPNYGAEDKDYEDGHFPYHAKNDEFETMDELMLVKGMTPVIFDRILPYITAYGEGPVNVNTALPEVLEALGLEPSLAEKIDEYRRGVDRLPGTTDDRFFGSSGVIYTNLNNVIQLNAGEKAQLEAAVSEGRLGTESLFFTVISQGSLYGVSTPTRVRAVVKRPDKIVSCRIETR